MLEKLQKERKFLPRSGGAEAERDSAQRDDRRATTATELTGRNSSSLPTICGRWL